MINIVIDVAVAQSVAPTTKIATAASNIRRRPKRSPSFPYNGMTAVAAARYEVTTPGI
jgi:hypothetical protein